MTLDSKIKLINGSDVAYSFVLPFEVRGYERIAHDWMQENHDIGFLIGLIYLSFIMIGKDYMKERPPLKVRSILALWNIFMCAFSALGTFRASPEVFHVLRHHGLHHSICKNTYIEDSVHSFWATALVLSKTLELIDTAFIIVKKQPLHHLHWIHHVSTMCVTFTVYHEAPAVGRWSVAFNYFIHAFMYGYFAIRCFKIHIPKWISITITTAQIMQMVACLVFVTYALIYVLIGGQCDISYKALILLFGMYATFFLLFLNFFVQTYVIKGLFGKKKQL